MIEMGLFIMLPVLLCTIVIKHTLVKKEPNIDNW
jgi:hypothetical protein